MKVITVRRAFHSHRKVTSICLDTPTLTQWTV